MIGSELVSIIVPLYNVQQYLRGCLEAILAQTYINLEIILIDDGSTDGSALLCDEYAVRDQRIFVVHKQNGGQAAARNLGLTIAHGEYIVFIDSDDIVSADHIETLYSLIKKYNSEISAANLIPFVQGEEIPSQVDEEVTEHCVSSIKAVEIMNYQKAFDTWPVCKMYHKSIFSDGLRFPEGIIFEDFEVVYQFLLKADKVAYTSKSIYYYLLRPDSTEGAKISDFKVDCAIKVIESYQQHEMLFLPILKSYKCRLVSFAFHLLLQMPSNHPHRSFFIDLVKKYRSSVIFNTKARFKTNVACLLSYFSFSLLKKPFSFVNKRK